MIAYTLFHVTPNIKWTPTMNNVALLIRKDYKIINNTIKVHIG